MINWESKLTSRKFWAAIASFVGMLITALGASENIVVQVTALIMAGGSVIAYIIGEGLVDAAGAKAGVVAFTKEDLQAVVEDENVDKVQP